MSSEQITAAELNSAIATLKDEVIVEANKIVADAAARQALENTPPATWGEFWWRLFNRLLNFPTSGLFFICLGGFLLKIAYETMGGTLSAFSFVLVVLGIAVLLYGTGTQGMARFQSGTSAGYNVAIAGGAGALAFIAAWGITTNSEAMKTAFVVQKQYTRVPIRHLDNSKVLGLYTFEFSIDGVAIPAMRQGNSLEMLVPYTATEFSRLNKNTSDPDQTKPAQTDALHANVVIPQATNANTCFDQSGLDTSKYSQSGMLVKTVQVNLYLMPDDGTASTNKASLETTYKKDYLIWIPKPGTNDGGYDLPKTDKSVCVNLLSEQRAKADAAQASNRQEPTAGPLNKTPPAANITQLGTGTE